MEKPKTENAGADKADNNPKFDADKIKDFMKQALANQAYQAKPEAEKKKKDVE